MKIKTFYAKTMAEALQEIKATLGPDALLLASREIPNRSGAGAQASGFEVVAASDDLADDGSYPRSDESEKTPDSDYACFGRRALDASLSLAAGRPTDRQASNGAQPSSPASPSREVDSNPATRERAFTSQDSPGTSNTCIRSKTSVPTRAVPSPRASASPRAASDPRVPDASSGREPSKPSAPALAPPKSDKQALSTGQSSSSEQLSQKLYQDLLSSGVDEWLARKLLMDAMERIVPRQRQSRAELLRATGQAAGGLMTRAASPDGTPAKRVVVFVGPTGVGKTTAIAKLAARLALRQKKKVVLMTLDGFRIGAIEQLRSYAGLLGIPFRYISPTSDLPGAIQELGPRDYILIDTAGRSPRDLAGMKELAEFLQSSDQTERHLVLSAATKPSDMKDIVDRYEICRPDHLLFTKLDETWTLGPILNELIRTRKPMSYYSDGQRVPEDLHVAPPEQIVDIVLSGRYLW